MARRTLLILALALCAGPAVVGGANDGEDAAAAVVDGLVGSSPQTWDLASLTRLMREDPRRVIRLLVNRLDVDRAVAGLPDESQIYNVCGHALTLLERLTHDRICVEGRPWIGFATHDRRGARPSIETIAGPWRAWLAVRKEIPVTRWFWGLAYEELTRIQPLMRRMEAVWTRADLDPVVALGRRAWPYLLAKLRDDEYAVDGRRFCDQANALLRKLTGTDLGEIERVALLELGPEDPRCKHRLALATNRASMDLLAQRWTAALLARSAQPERR